MKFRYCNRWFCHGCKLKIYTYERLFVYHSCLNLYLNEHIHFVKFIHLICIYFKELKYINTPFLSNCLNLTRNILLIYHFCKLHTFVDLHYIDTSLAIVKKKKRIFIYINCTWFVVYIKHQVHVLLLPGWEMSLFYVLQTVAPHLQPFVLCYLRILETERIPFEKPNQISVMSASSREHTTGVPF